MKSLISSSVTELFLATIMSCESAAEAWTKLNESLKGTRDQQIVLNLIDLFSNQEVFYGGDMASFVRNFMSKAHKLLRFGEIIPEKHLILLLLMRIDEKAGYVEVSCRMEEALLYNTSATY